KISKMYVRQQGLIGLSVNITAGYAERSLRIAMISVPEGDKLMAAGMLFGNFQCPFIRFGAAINKVDTAESLRKLIPQQLCISRLVFSSIFSLYHYRHMPIPLLLISVC